MKPSSPTMVRLPEHLKEKVAVAAEKMQLPLADVMRIAIGLGLSDLSLIGYDIDGVLQNAVHDKRAKKEKI